MDFANRTPLPAELFRTAIDETRLAASVVARATFSFGKGGEPALAEEQFWKICKEPVDTEYGQMEMDQVLRKGGVDLFLFGTVWAPGRTPIAAMQIGLDVGKFSRRAIVVGDRVWRKSGKDLVPTQPRPFTSMPLVIERAFGGKTSWDGLELPHPDNARGVGFYDTENEAVGKPLPNIEEPDQLIKSWVDRPMTAGFGFLAMQTSLRLTEGVKLDDKGMVKEFTPRLFNSAFPRMTAPAVQPGERVQILGMSPQSRPIELAVPSLQPVLRLRFDAQTYEQKAEIEQIGFEPDKQRMFVTYRVPFRYVINPGQLRSCELAMA